MRKRLLAVLALSGLGIGISGYLSLVDLTTVPLYCPGGSAGCTEVLSSMYARIGGVPIAALGLTMYLGLFGMALVCLRSADPAFSSLAGIFALSLVGVIFSGYLTFFVEAVILRQFCNWCLVSAGTVTAIASLSFSLVRSLTGQS